MTDHFPLPTSWQVEPYDTHYSFAYVSECGQREDFEFRVEFTGGVRRHEQLAVIALVEAAPRLLGGLRGLIDGIGSLPVVILTGPLVDALENARSVIADATGRTA